MLVKFQSTLSMRRATHRRGHRLRPADQISIHALHEESDFVLPVPASSKIFQSTLSMRRATWWDGERLRVFKFQSTLSMRRATPPFSSLVDASNIPFQSTLSMRRATFWLMPHRSLASRFQSTLSMRRATDGILQREDGSFDFNPRSP